MISNIQGKPVTAASLHNLATNASVTIIDKDSHEPRRRRRRKKMRAQLGQPLQPRRRALAALKAFSAVLILI
jgi:hypothetical protein